MSIHFAAANTPSRSRPSAAFAQAMVRLAMARCANDNDTGTPQSQPQALPGQQLLAQKRCHRTGGVNTPANDQVLRAALRHFAEHGLGAARAARIQAEQAFFAGDRQSYDWWLGITRTLDRRLAKEAEHLSAGTIIPCREIAPN
jgi:hypothetical protein